MVFNFFEAAIDFVDTLDRIVRNAFGVFSSKKPSNEMTNEPNNEGQRDPSAGKYEITPPPRAYISKHVTSKHHSRDKSERIYYDEVHVRSKEDELHGNVELESLVVKKGHVKKLIKMYDESESSNLSSECVVRDPYKQDLTKKPCQLDSFPIPPQRHVEPKPCVHEEKTIHKVVTKPPKIASVSSILSHHSKVREPAKSDQRITLFEEDEASYTEDSNKSRENGNDDDDSALERRIRRKTVWSMFCIPMW